MARFREFGACFGFDSEVDLLCSRSVKKRYSFPLRAGHKHAYLCTEGAVYRYMVNLDAAKAWFKSNVREIVRLYGRQHKVQREDVFLGKFLFCV